MTEIRTITLSEKGQISIPKSVRKEMNLKKGEKLLLMSEKGRIILTKVNEMLKRLEINAESTETMLASQESLKKEWNNEYDERWNKY
ncbi:MAG: AbrB/MazE/SpoVT family DNA-binding domain-containing protein [Candidatus Woesearchaeota archaeon]